MLNLQVDTIFSNAKCIKASIKFWSDFPQFSWISCCKNSCHCQANWNKLGLCKVLFYWTALVIYYLIFKKCFRKNWKQNQEPITIRIFKFQIWSVIFTVKWIKTFKMLFFSVKTTQSYHLCYFKSLESRKPQRFGKLFPICVEMMFKILFTL